MLKDEVNIIKELPPNLKLLDVEAAGSLVRFSLKLKSWDRLYLLGG